MLRRRGSWVTMAPGSTCRRTCSHALSFQQPGPVGPFHRHPADREFAWVRAKFQKEARLQAALHHPSIIAIYSLEEDADTRELYLVCEYANGGSLADQLAAGCVPEAQAIIIGRDMCAALDAT